MTEGSGRPADDLVDDQIAYYRARAPWYDDWWEARGQYERSPQRRAAWLAERAVVEADLDAWARELAGAEILELAAGTGNLTRIVARHAARITAVDSSPEVLEHNAAKLASAADRIEYRIADLFTWVPDRRWDAAYFGFWVSHVPPGRWERFWRTVHDALVPGGRIWLCDNAPPERAWARGLADRPRRRA